MAITLNEYLKKNEELTLQEQENKIKHHRLLDEIEQTHRRRQQQENADYRAAVNAAQENYLASVRELHRQKRALKIERILTYEEEQKALGAVCE